MGIRLVALTRPHPHSVRHRNELLGAERHLLMSVKGDVHNEPVAVLNPGNCAGVHQAARAVHEERGRPAMHPNMRRSRPRGERDNLFGDNELSNG